MDLLGVGQAAAGLISTGLNAGMQHWQNKQNRRFAESMFKWQNAESLANWNRQNEYNDPSAQMARLKKAGINPMMVYGNGATTLAQPIQKASPTDYRGQAPQIQGVPEILGQYVANVKMQQQTDNLKAQKELMEQQLKLQQQELENKKLGFARGQFELGKGQWELDRSKSLLPYQLQAAEYGNYKTLADINFTQNQQTLNTKLANQSISKSLSDMAVNQARINHMNVDVSKIRAVIANLGIDTQLKGEDLNLKKKGLWWSDPKWMRIASTIADEAIDAARNGKTGFTPSFKKWVSDVSNKYLMGVIRP